MSTAVQTLLVLLLLAGALLLGIRWGSGRERRGAADAVNGAFAAGFRAGHLEGWRDAAAAAERRSTTVPAVAPAPAKPPAASAPVRPAASGPVRPQPPEPRLRPGQALPPQPAQHQQAAWPVRAPQAAPRAAPPESAEERAARKERRDRQNINVTLYIASLLLVAAGALFVGTSLPEVLRFAGVLAVTGLFYGAGLVLHARAPRLRPAAVAFAGTGLALVPVAGLALYNFALPDGPAAWLVTSVVGTVAYILAAVRMDSRILVYLSLTFLVSTTCSGITVLGGALVWYFAAMIGLAAVLTLLALLRPRWLPSVYLKPLMDLHPFVVPAVALAVTLVPLPLGKGEYTLIMVLCGAYFALMAAVPQSRFRVAQYYGARLCLTLAAAVGVWAVSDGLSWPLLTALVLAALQTVMLASGLNLLPDLLLGSDRRRRADALATYGLQLLLTLLWAAATLLDAAGSTAAGVPLWLPLLLALLTGMVLAVRLGGAAEWAPVPALMLAGTFGDRAGDWAPAGFLVLAALFWAWRARPASEPLRRHFVLAARIVATAAVPAIVAAAVRDGPDDAAFVVVALVLALVAQQLGTAVLLRAGVATFAPNASLAAFSAAAVPALAVLALTDGSDGMALTGAAVVLQLLASLGTGWALHPRSDAAGPWRPAVAELLPLGMSLALVGTAFAAVSVECGNVALALAVLYLAAAGQRRRDLQHRWSYWWLGRAAGTVLVLTAFHQLSRAGGPLRLGGEEITLPTVAVLALGLQLAFPLLAEIRARAPRGVFADAAAVLALQVLTMLFLRTTGFQDPAAGGWQLTAAVIIIALGAAASGFVLRARAGSAVFAPAALAVLLLARAGTALDVELVLGIFAAFSAVMVVSAAGRTAKGVYFASARVLTLALALVLSYDATASMTAVSVTFALVLAAQHVVRWLMRHRLQEVPFQQAAVWITLAGQAVLPVSYLMAKADDGGRWVVLLQLALLLVSAPVASRVFAARGASYLAVPAAVLGTVALGPLLEFEGSPPAEAFLAGPLLSHDGVVLGLLGLSAAAMAAGRLIRSKAREGIERWLWLAAAGAFAVSALALAPLASGWLTGASLLVLAAVCFTASHLERWPVLYLPAAGAVLAGATLAVSELLGPVPGPWGSFLPWLAGCGLAGAGLYAGRVLRRDALAADRVRRWALAGAATLGLAAAAAAGLRLDATSWAGAALVAATAAVVSAEMPPQGRRLGVEVGLFASTAALQRAVLFTGPGWPDPFWTLQWYVVLAATLGALRMLSGNRRAGRMLISVAAGLLSLAGLGILFGGDAGQQLWTLALLAVLLAAGLAYGERLFVWWGAAGVTLCVMWAMRQYTFALLALIAAALIAAAVWRLNRAKPAAAEPAVERQPVDHG